MGALYASLRSWGMEEEGVIPFPDWKGVDEYRDPVDPKSLSSNFAVVFTEVASLLNYHVERTVEGLPVSFPISIQGKQDNTKYRSSRNNRVELKKTVIH